MRIRSIKPEFWSSDDIAKLCWDDRLLFIGLWSYVDDSGVGRDSDRLIAAELFPLDANILESVAKVREGLARLHEAGLITRYTAEGRDYLHICTWSKHQRIDKPRRSTYPPVTREDVIIRGTLATTSRNVAEPSTPGSREQGNKGTREQVSLVAAPTRSDVEEILDHLDQRIAANGARVPSRTKTNTDAARLMLDADDHPLEEIHHIIEWATRDDFWKANILSAKKLREKYDQLKIKSQAHRSNSDPRQSIFDSWEARLNEPPAIEGTIL